MTMNARIIASAANEKGVIGHVVVDCGDRPRGGNELVARLRSGRMERDEVAPPRPVFGMRIERKSS